MPAKEGRCMEKTVCIVGMGYGGLPLAAEFSKKIRVTGFDSDKEKIRLLQKGIDYTGENYLSGADKSGLFFTSRTGDIRNADFVIIAVPTPVDEKFRPDLQFVKSACVAVGKNLKKGAVVVLESTVYPGVTEEVCLPLLEKHSGMKCGTDFRIGYSPERINTGDAEHSITRVVKVVAGMDRETTGKIASLYGRIIKAGVFRAKDIRTAEASKITENIQRDVNIALMNELSVIFEKMGVDSRDVIEAASTKWNFAGYYPGMVGGHCIPVDPYYLIYRAGQLGCEPELMQAGRAVNNSVPARVADMALEELGKAGRKPQESVVLVMGLTFKENVRDVRNSPAKELIRRLVKEGVKVKGYDPLLDAAATEKFGVEVLKRPEFDGIDCVIIASPHKEFSGIEFGSFTPKPAIIDVRGFFRERKLKEKGFSYRQL
jgi:nucleotide sugar dehydrogenase